MLEALKEEAIVNKVGGRFKLSTLLAGHHLPLDGLSDHVATLLVARDPRRC